VDPARCRGGRIRPPLRGVIAQLSRHRRLQLSGHFIEPPGQTCTTLLTPSSSQFAGRGNNGNIAKGRTGPTGVFQAAYFEEAAHAKNVGDGLASEIKGKVAAYVQGGFAVEPGARSQVLLLAQLHPKPLRDAGNKTGIWSPDDIIYAYYSKEVLDKRAKEDFMPYKDSKKYHFRFGPNDAPEKAGEGKLTVREGFCACSSCHAPKFDFKNCLFKTMLGKAASVVCPPVRQPEGVTTKTGEIAEFAKKVKHGQVRAVDVAADQVTIEGAPFWLCQIVDDAFQASSDTVFAGDHFPEGFYLVKIKWYQFDRLGSRGERCYRLVEEERMLSVHSLIRCDVNAT
jgi:hypothetical protein